MRQKERAWIEEYLRCWNATEAARRAGYKWPNKVGHRKLEKFADEIAARVASMSMSADEVLMRLGEIARGEHSEYITTTGKVDTSAMVEDGKAHLIKSIKSKQFGKDIEFHDMMAALVHIGKHLGLFVERHDLTSGGEPFVLRVAGFDEV